VGALLPYRRCPGDAQARARSNEVWVQWQARQVMGGLSFWCRPRGAELVMLLLVVREKHSDGTKRFHQDGGGGLVDRFLAR
jgi:hypothetical protein